LVHLGHVLALDGDAPDPAEHLAWVTGRLSVPAPYQAALARAAAAVTIGDAEGAPFALKSVRRNERSV
jgi:hypothetical protein